ncbi:DUF3054 domain-containing protein [Enteractinococcus coprophilus]|uniref:DUF3054 family protein n=1 Tax=Enteractinococcus coprophilus TaxID=1027633 RepID=A0A543AJD3_9MICC|nr:DUF3054 domain-containing protein [Enteractinococcus coprophilus]TQL72695.1 DUF3054 family protein [Enteractinococcus coprophilus]
MTSEPLTATKSTVAILLIVDAILIVVFAMIGISSHEGALEPLSIARVAIPFLIPYLLLAGCIKPTQFIHNIFPMGVILWLSTVILGPILRAVLFGDTSALPFILVTAGVLAVLLIGRRIISTLVSRRKQTA